MVSQEQARRRRAEVALEAAVTEVGTAQQGKTMAEMEAEKAQQMLELEVKLRQQISKEKDQVLFSCPTFTLQMCEADYTRIGSSGASLQCPWRVKHVQTSQNTFSTEQSQQLTATRYKRERI